MLNNSINVDLNIGQRNTQLKDRKGSLSLQTSTPLKIVDKPIEMSKQATSIGKPLQNYSGLNQS